MATVPKRFRPAPPSPPLPADPDRQVACLSPNVARAVLTVAEQRGISTARLCQGLGFTDCDLQDPALLLSHQQTRTLILRALALIGDPAFGLACGARQTPVSWGLTGLLMLTCPTYGEAIVLALAHQAEAGAMMEHRLEEHGDEMHLVLVPHWLDLGIEQFLVEESMSCLVAVSRALLHTDEGPLRVELAIPRPAHTEAYRAVFRCPVHFDADAHRLVFGPALLQRPIPGYERLNCGALRQHISGRLREAVGRPDLLASLSQRLRLPGEASPRQRELAQSINLSDRTLRRRLSHQDTSYRELRDRARFDHACELLTQSALTIAEVAEAVGYSDARAFRRAFQRWAGTLPTAYRAARQRGTPPG